VPLETKNLKGSNTQTVAYNINFVSGLMTI